MRHIVIDTSCMIDLRKAALLDAALALPYAFVTPDTLFENEWLSPPDKKILCSGKFRFSISLTSSNAERSQSAPYSSPKAPLSINC